jgi:hypothetical protein
MLFGPIIVNKLNMQVAHFSPLIRDYPKKMTKIGMGWKNYCAHDF